MMRICQVITDVLSLEEVPGIAGGSDSADVPGIAGRSGKYIEGKTGAGWSPAPACWRYYAPLFRGLLAPTYCINR